MPEVDNFPALLQAFFTTRLMSQRKVSPHTIASYRDTFRLLLQFAQKRLRKVPAQLKLEDLDSSMIGAFLDDLERDRGNSARSRNLRLTAVRSFFRYAALEAPGHAGVIQRVLAIPNQRQLRALVSYLSRRRSIRCWRFPIRRRGWDVVIMPSCSPLCRLDCDYQR
jgi:site-specific recombinase XerD